MSVPSGAPALLIVLPVEGSPKVIPAVVNESEFDRLADWIDANPDRLALLTLAARLRDEPLAEGGTT